MVHQVWLLSGARPESRLADSYGPTFPCLSRQERETRAELASLLWQRVPQPETRGDGLRSVLASASQPGVNLRLRIFAAVDEGLLIVDMGCQNQDGVHSGEDGYGVEAGIG